MSSAISTWNGHRTAKERASDVWGVVILPEPEESAHSRMMAAIRRLEKSEHADRIEREEPQRDMNKWRRAQNAHLKKQFRDTCRMCLGTGEITVSDGHGCVDFDMCPRCSWFEPYAGEYPTADDAMEISF